MQLGWIDFSKNERDKVLGVLESLTEQGTLDELGIAPIRDGFADLFFPGTSTLQRRAKYFLLIPYMCKDLERSDITNPNVAKTRLYDIEREVSEILHKNDPKELGIIGGDYIGRRDWIRRPPSTLYWAGLRRYGIFNESLSLFEYFKASCSLKKLKKDNDALKKLGNKNDKEDCDDRDAGATQNARYFTVRTYRTNWKDDLSIRLTKAEAQYLKERIILSAPDSLLAYFLKTNDQDIFKCKSFNALPAIIRDEKLKDDCETAVDFSNFLYVLRVVYNLVVSREKNQEANKIIDELRPDLKELSDIDINAIFLRLEITNRDLRSFLSNAKTAMADGNIDRLKFIVTEREGHIKGKERAKTMNAGTFDENKWFGGRHLDYRLLQATQLLRDIFDGETNNV